MLEDVERRRSQRERLKRRSSLGREDYDIVAAFTHNRIVDVEKTAFIEHRSLDDRRGTVTYSVKNDICDNVVEMGTEVNTIDEGFDFAVAIVDVETGNTTYRPARLFNFEAKFAADVRILTGEKKAAPIDYGAQYDIKTEDWAKKRMELTSNFGSAKKLKIQEAAVRRQINNETLDAMKKTAFASVSVLKEEEDVKPEQISLVNKAESSILPRAVKAELPRDIYPLSLFVSNEELEAFSEIATQYISTPRKELVDSGFPDCVSQLISNVRESSRAVAFTLLGCMTFMSSMWAKSRSITKKEYETIPFPEAFVQKVKTDFISADFDRGLNGKMIARLSMSTQEKDKLVAHLLALALTISPGCSIPVTPWQVELKISPRAIDKILIGLGCDLVQCNVEEAARTNSIRAARLLHPPNREYKRPRRIRR